MQNIKVSSERCYVAFLVLSIYFIRPAFSCSSDKDCRLATGRNKTLVICCTFVRPKQCLSDSKCWSNFRNRSKHFRPTQTFWNSSKGTEKHWRARSDRDEPTGNSYDDDKQGSSPSTSPPPNTVVVVVVILLFIIFLPIIIGYEIYKNYHCCKCFGITTRLQSCPGIRSLCEVRTAPHHIVLVVHRNGRQIHTSHIPARQVLDEPPPYEDVILPPPPRYEDLLSSPPKYEDIISEDNVTTRQNIDT